MGGIQKTGHFLRGFAFDPHGQTKRADLQVAQTAVQNLAKQVGGLRAVKRPRAVFAASDFSDVCAYAHGGIVDDAVNVSGRRWNLRHPPIVIPPSRLKPRLAIQALRHRVVILQLQKHAAYALCSRMRCQPGQDA